jgi:hypothetical protein
MDASKSVTATFQLMQFTIATTSDGSGSISPMNPIVNYGDSQLFIAVPNEGYVVDCWYLDGSSVQSGGVEYTLDNIQDDHAVYVTFRRLSYSIFGRILEPDANTP